MTMVIESDLKLIPEQYRSISISDKEIVLPYPEVIEAIEYLKENNIAFSGWEGWAKYKNNRISPF